jgi:hypothetical protein
MFDCCTASDLGAAPSARRDLGAVHLHAIADGASATINRSLEVARTILHRRRSYRDECGHSWLDAVPPLIAMLPECARPPYPITWEEQDRLFPKLPAHLARMVLFAVNTDCATATCAACNGVGK